MVKETSEILDQIKLIVENNKKLSLRTHTISKAVEEQIKEAIKLILEKVESPSLLPTLYTITKELTINACKANQKRVFFEDKKFDLEDLTEYKKGVREYRESFSDAMSNELGAKAKSMGYYCLIHFSYNDESILVEVINNTPIAYQEERAIRERLGKGMSYDDIAQFYMDNADNTEGAGLGLALILILLKGEGIDPNHFRIVLGEDLTIARLEIPILKNYTTKQLVQKN